MSPLYHNNRSPGKRLFQGMRQKKRLSILCLPVPSPSQSSSLAQFNYPPRAPPIKRPRRRQRQRIVAHQISLKVINRGLYDYSFIITPVVWRAEVGMEGRLSWDVPNKGTQGGGNNGALYTIIKTISEPSTTTQ